MMTAQFTLSGPENRWFIACCIKCSGMLTPYIQKGRILFKGGATVSCLTMLMFGEPMRLCGRISRLGMSGPKEAGSKSHALLYRQGDLIDADGRSWEILKSFGPDDCYVIGANAIDSFGHAAMLVGSPAGGTYGKCLPTLYSEGFKVIIPVSAQKLVPGNLEDIYPQVGIKKCDIAYGMRCGLLPIPGVIVTEREAAEAYADVKAVIFAAGGHTGSESAVAVQISGSESEVKKVLDLVEQVRSIPEGPLGDEVSDISSDKTKRINYSLGTVTKIRQEAEHENRQENC